MKGYTGTCDLAEVLNEVSLRLPLVNPLRLWRRQGGGVKGDGGVGLAHTKKNVIRALITLNNIILRGSSGF